MSLKALLIRNTEEIREDNRKKIANQRLGDAYDACEKDGIRLEYYEANILNQESMNRQSFRDYLYWLGYADAIYEFERQTDKADYAKGYQEGKKDATR